MLPTSNLFKRTYPYVAVKPDVARVKAATVAE